MAASIPVHVYLFLAIGVLVTLFGPVIFLVIYCRHTHVSAVPALVGAIAFPIAVFFLEAKFAIWLTSFPAVVSFLDNPVSFTIWAGLMAGAFEETTRLICLYFLSKRYPNIRTGFVYGIGHGGIEAILVVGLLDLILLITIIWGNIAGGSSLPGMLGISAETYSSATILPVSSLLLPSIERIIAMTIHIGNSVLVYLAVSQRGKFWLWPVAIGLHALSGVAAALYQYGLLQSLLVVELYSAVVAVGTCFFSYKMVRHCTI